MLSTRCLAREPLCPRLRRTHCTHTLSQLIRNITPCTSVDIARLRYIVASGLHSLRSSALSLHSHARRIVSMSSRFDLTFSRYFVGLTNVYTVGRAGLVVLISCVNATIR
jgi:hypothetical protein